MSEKCKTITGVLKRSGTDQSQRTIEMLDPNSLELHDFGISEWMKFAIEFAKHVNYYNTENSSVPVDNWQTFFSEFNDAKPFLEDLNNSDELTPHLTLFMCFLKLLELPKKRLNGLTKKHLDFFYGEVLKIEKLKERSDSVHVLFELAKNFDQEKLQAGLQLDGGKDKLGIPRVYALDEEIVANQAQVVYLKNVYKHFGIANADNSDVNNYFRVSSVANSFDGIGGGFPAEDKSWMPFGYYQNDTPSSIAAPKLPILPKAKIGFSVASPILNLSEGSRFVQITIEFKEPIAKAFTPQELFENISFYYTAKNSWIGPLNLFQSSNLEESFTNLTDEKIESFDVFTSSCAGSIVKLAINLEAKDKPTSAFDNLLHFGRYNTTDPIFKFEVNVNSEIGALIHDEFSKTIKGVNIHVGVSGIKQLILDSDHGTLNTRKPMHPFTQNPVKGSSLVINHPEIFSKRWSLIETEINWKNTPDDFKNWYSAYKKDVTIRLSQEFYLASQYIANKAALQNNKIEAGNSPQPSVVNEIVTGDDYFKAQRFVKYNDEWELFSQPVSLFTSLNDDEKKFKCNFTVLNQYASSTDAGPIKLSLLTPFLHQIYPQLYAVAMTSESTTAIIPNPPYTPFADEISVSYFAKESLLVEESDMADFENRKIRLFHEHPFGNCEENAVLKSANDSNNTNCSLLPIYNKGGELFIGLKNVQPLQTVSLLVQLQEGSENPLAETFNSEKVTWEILCSDQWKKLDTLSIIRNEIDNFLKTGLITIKIPKEASKENTQLEGDVHWIKAVMPKTFDAVCRVLDIRTQGAKATFVNNKNELSHLEKGIPGMTISKLIARSPNVKTVSQPYNSFNGKLQETDESYYKRVSERLRHKHRAIMLWDYENIVLQEFTDIYKVKCLNHTNYKSFLAAGCVTLVVIPDTKDKNMFNIYQPRVSTAKLNEVKNYVSQLTSLHVKLDVINPSYEEIKIFVDVKFYPSYDVAQYKIQLDLDLKKFLSPWAFDSSRHIEFGVTLHNSVLLNFIEKLDYVDYVSSLRLKVDNGSFTKNCSPSSPKAILVSSDQHIINEAESVCSLTELSTTEEC